MTIGGKVITGVATLGTIGGGGLLANSLLNKPIIYAEGTAGARLIKEGFDLDIGNEWQTVLDAHNTVKNTKDTFKADNNTDLKLNELQSKCQSALKEKDDANYKKARQWCVKEKAIKDIFEKINLRKLDADGTSDDTSAWKTKETELKQNVPVATTLNAEMKNTGTIDITKIKQGCRTIIEITTTSLEFNDKFELAKKWCAV